jgi:Repeat of unknown function (DUF5648)
MSCMQIVPVTYMSYLRVIASSITISVRLFIYSSMDKAMFRPNIRFFIAAILLSLAVTLFFPMRLIAQNQYRVLAGLERLYNQQTDDHFYTSNLQEVCDVVHSASYVHVGSLGACISNEGIEGTTALYRLFKPGGGHFYTISDEEVGSAQRDGYSYEGVSCYVWTSSNRLAECPIYRLYNPSSDRHFYTTDENEANNASGYSYEGTQGFLGAGSKGYCGVDDSNLIR